MLHKSCRLIGEGNSKRIHHFVSNSSMRQGNNLVNYAHYRNHSVTRGRENLNSAITSFRLYKIPPTPLY
ncbi:hypothetical protein Desti_2139 [Desulfomonile tiedjei DSM 6799]|uniref:Uncharacterized protein n=1 Tax=Desulfomonile tiedjei (strain ATCC 49306 / DSM 6799 / DCB-1) TaxID=706587 RepID=I4C5J6_DESTA|nr:hypothetical protein Desti_2139 [Desulfomonile tiedjei DSM 6799]